MESFYKENGEPNTENEYDQREKSLYDEGKTEDESVQMVMLIKYKHIFEDHFYWIEKIDKEFIEVCSRTKDVMLSYEIFSSRFR